jgi:hypothetical protein
LRIAELSEYLPGTRWNPLPAMEFTGWEEGREDKRVAQRPLLFVMQGKPDNSGAV